MEMGFRNLKLRVRYKRYYHGLYAQLCICYNNRPLLLTVKRSVYYPMPEYKEVHPQLSSFWAYSNVINSRSYQCEDCGL